MKYLLSIILSLSFYLTAIGQNTPDSVSKKYYPSGKIQFETPFIDGKKNGVEKWYLESGRLWSETPYANGKKNGIEIDYFVTGKLRSKTTYVGGLRNGVQQIYHEDGKILLAEITFVNDNWHSSKEYDGKGNVIRENKGASSQTQNISVRGSVKVIHPWCTDILTDKTAEYVKPRPLPNETLYIREGNINDFSKPIVMACISDTAGNFEVSLPTGTYCIIADNKKDKPNYDSLIATYVNGTKFCRPMSISDTGCIRKWYGTPEKVFSVGSDSVKGIVITFTLPCSTDCTLPCGKPRYIRY